MRGDHLYRPVVFEEPDLIVDPPAWSGLIPFAFWVVDALRPRVLVELGTHSGVSYCAFCQAVSYLKLPTTCCAVDTWQGDVHAGFYGEEVFQALASYHDPRYGSFSRLIRTTFDQAVEHFSDSSIDLLHIDGCHTYDAVRHDFQTWLPKLSDRSVVLFHDINVREMDFEIWRFWEEITQQYPSFSLFHSHGLGVLAVGTKLPKPIRWLTEASKRDTQETIQIRAFFARLGGAVVASIEKRHLRTETDRLRTLTAERENQIAALKKSISEKDVHIRNLEAAVHDKDTHISNLDTALSDKDNHIRNIEAELKPATEKLAERDTELQHATSRLQAREEQLSQVQCELETERRQAYQQATQASESLNALSQEKETISRTLSRLQEKHEQQETRLQEVEENRQILKKHLAEEGKRVEHLRSQVGQLTSRLTTTEADLRDRAAASEKLEQRLGAAESLLAQHRTEREFLESTASWKLVQRYWAWNMRWLPFGTRRRRAYTAVVHGLARLLFGHKVREQVPDQPAPPMQPVSQPVPEEESAQEQQEEIRLSCDEPQPGEYCGKALVVRGWALASSGIQRVEVVLDGQNVGQASYGQARPDVAEHLPQFKDSQLSGFLYRCDLNGREDGAHQLVVVPVSRKGTRKEFHVPFFLDKTRKSTYERWIELHEQQPKDPKEMVREAEHFSYRPLVSIVMPVYNTPEVWLQRAIESVLRQGYVHWELCICDDSSTEPHVRRVLENYVAQDPRIRVVFAESNGGISRASNRALALATGEFIGLLDHDDELSPNALYEVVKLLQEHPEADMIYSDEDKLELDGRRVEPFFKPDWSPDLFLSNMYTCHFGVYRRHLVKEIGGFRKGFEGSQDYDLVLRLTEQTEKIHHIPLVLYHWRKVPSSAATTPGAKNYTHEASKKALTEALQRRGIDASVEDAFGPNFFRIRRKRTTSPLVSIVIPTRDKLELLKKCLKNIEQKTSWRKYEIILIDNDSRNLETRHFLEKCLHRVVKFCRPFNFAAMCNLGAQVAAGEYLLFLNNDVESINPDWLEAMLEHAQRPEVGVVGAKLLYPNGLIQHAGVILGMGGVASHAHRFWPGSSPGYFGLANVIHNCSAVTAACMLVRTSLFRQLGGMDENNLPVTYNDVDFCLKVREKGYLVVYTPYARLKHYESATRGHHISPKESSYMQQRWGEVLWCDPYYNRNLALDREDFSLRF